MESNPGSSVHSPGRFGAGRSGRFAERIQRPCKPGRPAIRRPPPCEHPGPRVGAVVEGFIVDENDPPWDTDPLWYDRAESGPAPGPVLECLAWLFLLAVAVVAGLVWLYGVPDRLWRAATRRFLRRRPAGAKRF